MKKKKFRIHLDGRILEVEFLFSFNTPTSKKLIESTLKGAVKKALFTLGLPPSFSEEYNRGLMANLMGHLETSRAAKNIKPIELISIGYVDKRLEWGKVFRWLGGLLLLGILALLWWLNKEGSTKEEILIVEEERTPPSPKIQYYPPAPHQTQDIITIPIPTPDNPPDTISLPYEGMAIGDYCHTGITSFAINFPSDSCVIDEEEIMDTVQVIFLDGSKTPPTLIHFKTLDRWIEGVVKEKEGGVRVARVLIKNSSDKKLILKIYQRKKWKKEAAGPSQQGPTSSYAAL